MNPPAVNKVTSCATHIGEKKNNIGKAKLLKGCSREYKQNQFFIVLIKN